MRESRREKAFDVGDDGQARVHHVEWKGGAYQAEGTEWSRHVNSDVYTGCLLTRKSSWHIQIMGTTTGPDPAYPNCKVFFKKKNTKL